MVDVDAKGHEVAHGYTLEGHRMGYCPECGHDVAIGPREHQLKCWPDFFRDLSSGVKTAEVRKNDRDYRLGDRLVLFEWIPETKEYTSRKLVRRVVYLSDLTSVGAPGFVLMCLEEEP